MGIVFEDDDLWAEHEPDIGYCPECGRDMSGEPAAAIRCTSCVEASINGD